MYVQHELARRDSAGRIPLLLAAEGGHAETIDLLLQHCRDPNSSDHSGQTALHLAATVDKLTDSIACALVEAKAQVDHQDNEGLTPLMVAASAGSIRSTSALLSLGANPAVVDQQGDCMHHHAAAQEQADWMIQFTAPPQSSAKLEKRMVQLQGASDEAHSEWKQTKFKDNKEKRRCSHPLGIPINFTHCLVLLLTSMPQCVSTDCCEWCVVLTGALAQA